MVTDGNGSLDAGFHGTWPEARRSLGFESYAVHVDSSGSLPPPPLAAIADAVIGLADVTDDAAVTAKLFGI